MTLEAPRPEKARGARRRRAAPGGATRRPKRRVALVMLPGEGDDRTAYRERLRNASRALVKAQKQIRILRALHWPDATAQRFFSRGARELPDPPLPPLPFDPSRKEEEFLAIERTLDPGDPLQAILRETALQYVAVIEMLRARGTTRFHALSRSLYGHPGEQFVGQTVTNHDLAVHLDGLLGTHDGRGLPPPARYEVTAEEAARILQRKFRRAFRGARVKVEVSSDLTADAAAGAYRVRVKRGRLFGRDTVAYLEHHEGYVHIGTGLNGRAQRWLPILGKASPRATRSNEGLAVFGEWASHTLTVRRMQRLVDRILAIRMAEDGADFLEVYRAFLKRGEEPGAAFDIARRVFRGGNLRGGAPFTKDASYLGDFLRIFNFARVAAKRHRLDLLELLFVGKVTVMDVPVLHAHLRTGEVLPPKFLPPWLRDPNWVATHMALSSFLNVIDLPRVEAFYEELFSQC